MNIKTLKLIEDFTSSNGIWKALEIINDTIYLEFNNVEIYSENSHYGDFTIRFAENSFLKVYYNEKEYVSFLKHFNENFYKEFSFKLKHDEFKFQNFNYINGLSKKYTNSFFLFGNAFDCDFILAFDLDIFAIILGGDILNFFKDFELLNEDMIKNLSNKWCIDYLNNI